MITESIYRSAGVQRDFFNTPWTPVLGMPGQAQEDTFRHTLDLTDTYLQLQNELKIHLKAGYFGLAQARYSLGASKVRAKSIALGLVLNLKCKSLVLQQVGPAQYDLSMKASRRVHVDMGGAVPKFHLSHTASTGSERIQPDSAPLQGSATMGNAADNAGTSQPAKPALYGEASLAQEFAEKFGLTEEQPLQDEPAEQRSPLTWFGFMVPQALRSSQGSFAKAVEVSVKLAELQSAMQTIQQQGHVDLDR